MKFFQACKDIIKYSIPMISSRLIGTAMGFVGMVMIAHLGHKQLAAGALVSSISLTLNVIFWSLLFSISVLAARCYTEGKNQEVGSILQYGIILGSLLGVFLMAIYWAVGPLLFHLHQEKDLVVLVIAYFHVLSFSVLPGMWFVCFAQFVTAVGRPRAVVYAAVAEFTVMVILGYGLIFGKLGLPNLGMVGMAYATVVAYCVGALVMWIPVQFHPYFTKFDTRLFKPLKHFGHFKKMITIGFPITMQFVSELTAFSFTTIMMGWLGEYALAAQQITNQLNCLVIMVPYGISQASAILVSHAIGRKDHHAIRSYGNASQFIGVCFSIVTCLFYLTFPKTIIHWFGLNLQDPKNALTIHTATLLLAIVAVSQIFDAVRNIATGSLRAFHDTKYPMINGFVVSWGIGIPLGYIFAFWLHLGAPGIAAGYIFGFFIGAVVLLRRFYKKIAIIRHEHENIH